jgi:uncharacterized membrane protein (UPF0136 family)
MSTPNYVAASLVAIGGIVGYFRTGSVVSAAASVGFALALFFASFQISRPSAKSKSIGFNIAIGASFSEAYLHLAPCMLCRPATTQIIPHEIIRHVSVFTYRTLMDHLIFRASVAYDSCHSHTYRFLQLFG